MNPQGERSAQLEYCSRILEELLSKKHASSARPFYNHADAEAPQPHEQHDVIRNPMDLSTIKVGSAPGSRCLAA